jgi:hypothetical protein
MNYEDEEDEGSWGVGILVGLIYLALIKFIFFL